MKNEVCVVTGSNSGIGKQTALGLANLGATVVLAVRNWQRGEEAKREIIGKTGNQEVIVMPCDVSSIESIHRFTMELRNKFARLDLLVNNAGAVFSKRGTTVDGFERSFAVNYLGAVILTNDLLSLLTSSAPSRIVNVGSGTDNSGSIDFGDLQNTRNYNGQKAYANAKLMLAMWTYDMARRLDGTGVTINVVHPGFVATNLGRNSGSLVLSLAFMLMRPFQINAKKGAATSVYLAAAPEMEKVSGKCYSQLQETRTAQISYDLEAQRRLVDATEKLLNSRTKTT